MKVLMLIQILEMGFYSKQAEVLGWKSGINLVFSGLVF